MTVRRSLCKSGLTDSSFGFPGIARIYRAVRFQDAVLTLLRLHTLSCRSVYLLLNIYYISGGVCVDDDQRRTPGALPWVREPPDRVTEKSQREKSEDV